LLAACGLGGCGAGFDAGWVGTSVSAAAVLSGVAVLSGGAAVVAGFVLGFAGGGFEFVESAGALEFGCVVAGAGLGAASPFDAGAEEGADAAGDEAEVEAGLGCVVGGADVSGVIDGELELSSGAFALGLADWCGGLSQPSP